MASRKPPRTIRLSESAPPPNFKALNDELNSGSAEQQQTMPGNAPSVMGVVKEKGFSTDPLPADRFSSPQPRVNAFPVARHRSEGPHWRPDAPTSSSPATQVAEDDGEDVPPATSAEPVHRKMKRQSDKSQWQSSRKSELSINLQTQNAFDDARLVNNLRTTAEGGPVEKKSGPQGKVQQESSKRESGLAAERLESVDTTTITGETASETRDGPFNNLEKHTPPPAAAVTRRRSAPVEERIKLQGEDPTHSPQATRSGRVPSTDHQSIDSQNRNAVLIMSSDEIAKAQAELTDRIRPDMLEYLRKRGAEKEKKRLAESARTSAGNETEVAKSGTSSFSSRSNLHHARVPFVDRESGSVPKIPSDFSRPSMPRDETASSHETQTVRGTRVGPADLLNAAATLPENEAVPTRDPEEENLSLPPPTTDPWTLRVEAVRSMRFDLGGSVLTAVRPAPAEFREASQSSSPAGMSSNNGVPVLSAVERDYLRTEGNPSESGYSMKEALSLARSTVPGQRAAALRVITSVLEKAVHGLQTQKATLSTSLHPEGRRESADWQAVWAYALGPEAELVLTLRLLLDDGHATVVAECARTMQALLSYTANESYFEAFEAVWPGDRVIFTSPIFRRKTQQNEGFIGGGRWKYNVKSSELFPFSAASADATEDNTEEEDGQLTVADDGHVSNKDVAAGLIRMGVLPRIRYILEVDWLIPAQDLLRVLVCLARHSPAAANAVMKCPRLIDTVLQRFVYAERDGDSRAEGDGDSLEESWSARLKATRLLKVLAQAKRSNCVHFEKIDTLQAVLRPFLRPDHAKGRSGREQINMQNGDYESMIEALHFWRVCIDYGIGISLFSDCYPTLCFWLLPLSEDEILTASSATSRDQQRQQPPSFSLATESYILLERLAKTLPLLHTVGESEAEPIPPAAAAGDRNWPWSVARAMVDTAVKWLSPECINAILVLLERSLPAPPKDKVVLNDSTRQVVGALAAVLNFLASVCEKTVSEEDLNGVLEDRAAAGFALPWLPTFVPKLGLMLARSGILNKSRLGEEEESGSPGGHTGMIVPVGLETKYTFMECLCFCQAQADESDALAAANCATAVVRLSGIVDKLIHISKLKAITTPLPPPDQEHTLEHKVLEQGLLLTAETQLRELFFYCKQNVNLRNDRLQMGLRGGPAPGLGVGWGSIGGGAWSKEVLLTRSASKLALDLMSVFSSPLWKIHSQRNGAQTSQTFFPDPFEKIKFGLMSVASATALDKELVQRITSNIVFHPSTISPLLQAMEGALVSSASGERAPGGDSKAEIHHQVADRGLNSLRVSEILHHHSESFWLEAKKRRADQDLEQGTALKKKPNLATVLEDSGEGFLPLPPDSLIQEWVGQRLPLPPHWFLSPMLSDSPQASASIRDRDRDFESKNKSEEGPTELEQEVIKSRLAFFLGFEAITANVSDADRVTVDVPLVRKIHNLSTVFVSGGETFLDPHAGDWMGALQSSIGNEIGKQSVNAAHAGLRHSKVGNEENVAAAYHYHDPPAEGTPKRSLLDFESGIDPSYVPYAEAVAEQFVAVSFGDLVFARQIALYLCLEVPDVIRLATWRVLSDGRALELLPPLSRCCGPSHIYLGGIEANQDILDSFVSTWSSGLLDKAAKRTSLAFTLALHHIAGYLFYTEDTEKTLLIKQKSIRMLIRSTVRKLDRQEMLTQLIRYALPSWTELDIMLTTQGSEKTKLTMTQLELRCLLLSKACEGDGSLMAEVGRLQSLLSTHRS